MPALFLAQPARPLEQHLPDVLAVHRVLADDVGAQQVHLVRAHGRCAAAADPVLGTDLEEMVARASTAGRGRFSCWAPVPTTIGCGAGWGPARAGECLRALGSPGCSRTSSLTSVIFIFAPTSWDGGY